MAKELLKRSEVNEEFTWDLTALYPDNTAWEAAMAEIQEMASDLAKMLRCRRLHREHQHNNQRNCKVSDRKSVV